MAESTTWLCPTCGRRVPNRATECHCGMLQVTALAVVDPSVDPPKEKLRIRTPPVRFRTMPKEVRVLGVVFALVILLGVVWAFVPRKPAPALPLLGTLDRLPSPPPTPQAPRATPTPRPSGATILGTPLPAPPARR